MGEGPTVELVRGSLDEATAAELLEFWEKHAGLVGEQARDRLPQVVCVLRGPGGGFAGINSAYPRDIPMIGGRRFWVYRALIPTETPGDPDEAWDRMFVACFDQLVAEFDQSDDGDAPIGLLAAIDVPGMTERRPEAIWSETGLSYAGFMRDGRQVRIRYFPEGRV